MNFTFVIFTLFLILHSQYTKCQRVTPNEMLEIAYNHSSAHTSTEFEQCLPAMKAEYHPEIPYIYSVCQADPNWLHILGNLVNSTTKCTGFQCWESQLTDITRLDILDIFNSYRQKVAKGTCGARCRTNKKRLVFELRWITPLELDAWYQFHESCPPVQNSLVKSRYFVVGNVTHKVTNVRPVQIYCRSWKVETGTQHELRSTLRKLVDENLFDDWDDEQQFSKGLAHDVGCAYVLRHNVTEVTTVGNETVVNGNVAHLCCTFGDITQTGYLNSSYESYTTTENCNKTDGASEVRPDALYPSLCKEKVPLNTSVSPAMICQPDPAYHGKQYDSLCQGRNSSKNPDTWNEKPYGLLLRFVTHGFHSAECNKPNLPEPPSNENTTCTSTKEVNVVTTSTSCDGWSCSDSQLTNQVRADMLNSLNTARHLVSQGIYEDKYNKYRNIQYCNVVRLRWHWYLEKKAAEKVQNCSTHRFSNRITYEDSPFQEYDVFEEVGVVFELPAGGQTKLPDRFADLFWTNSLDDWDKDGTFRRGSAAWIGCAVVIRPGRQINDSREEYKPKNGSVAHMVCVYVSLNEDFTSLQGSSEKHCCPSCTQVSESTTCRLKTAKNIEPFPRLCASILPVEVTMSCAVNNCPNETIRTNRTDTRLELLYSRKMCKILIFMFSLAMSIFCLFLALIYKHFVEKKSSSKSESKR